MPLMSTREIFSLDEVDPHSRALGKQLAKMARGFGLYDMHDVVVSYLVLVGGGAGVTEIELDVNVENVEDVYKKLIAAAIISLAYATNESFRVGSVIFPRILPPVEYLQLVEMYLKKIA